MPVGGSSLTRGHVMLKGKIAAILNDRTVVINLGSAHGVKPGMKFAATYETGTITDPDNPNDSLGDLSFVIAEIQATNVQKKMTVCNIIDPYIERFGLFATLTGQTESKIHSRAVKIADSEDLKLKVGTVVSEVPQGSGKEQPAKKESGE
jgi:hypothetical protein